MYYEADKVQALQYQKLVTMCFEKYINSSHYWKSNWRDLELEEFLKEERHNERMNQKMVEVVQRAKWKLGMGQYDTDQTPIEKEEIKIPRWSKSLVGIKKYREWWITKGRFERKEKLAQREEERKRKLRERRYNKKG
ncbi:hypothetical protein Hanom_Chr03g00213781 [Helianthus anomalus]